MKNKRGKREHMIGVWCTTKEYDDIESLAEKAGMSKGRYCRVITLKQLEENGNNQSVNEAMKGALRELSAIGNNLNQIARVANSTGSVNPVSIDEAKEELARIGRKILAIAK